MFRTFAALALIGFWTSASFGAIDKFMQVTPGLYRGAQPTAFTDYQMLKKLGVKTVIDLRALADGDHEEVNAPNAGLTFLRFPLTGWGYPNDAEVNQILAIIQNPANQPVFIHCHYGKDRTGMIVALHRVLYQGWTYADAYNEWLAFGYDRLLVGLHLYYYNKIAAAKGSPIP